MTHMRIPGQANMLDQLLDNDLLVLLILAGILLLVFLAVVFLFVKLIQSVRNSREGKAEKPPKPKKEKRKKSKKDRNTADKNLSDEEPSTEEPSVPAKPERKQRVKRRKAKQEKGTEDNPDLNAAPDSKLSNAQLSDITDVMLDQKAQLRPAPQKKEKHAKLKKAKRSTPIFVKWKARKLKVPTNVQKTIPYDAVYEQDGIIELSPGLFTKSYLLQDINYQIAKQSEQDEMFLKYGEFLNSFEPAHRFQITINQRNIDMTRFENETMLPLRGDNLDYLREERNKMLKDKIREGRNNMVKEKYLTVACKAESLENARSIFSRLDTELAANINKIGNAQIQPLSTPQRLEILHDIYNIGSEGYFGNNVELDADGTPVFAKDKFLFEIMRRQGLTTKDMIAPDSFTFKSDYGMIGDKYFRALFIRQLPTYVNDAVLAELTKTDCNMLTSLCFQPIEGEQALKMAKYQIVNINANVVEKQKQASKAGYSTELISPDLKDAADEADSLLRDLTSKNQKLFYMTLVIVHFADDLKTLNADTKTIQGIGRRLLCNVKKLSWQQENGLNSALPLCNNQLHIKRTLTTECAAVFMPFDTQELNEPTGMYYGNNAVSHNLIRLDRRQKKNGNGFIFGTPGSGKSMSAKQEMLTVLLSTDDYVIVIDPEGEYYEMAELLGGEVIRIAAGGDTYINPFDIDMDLGGEDDPITIKSDFIVSMCETVLGERYGLNPTQRSIIDRCVHNVYKPYLDSFKDGKFDENKLPTMHEFWDQLRAQKGYDAATLAEGLELYVKGSLNIFAHPTNVEYNKRFVVFDIRDIGSTMKSMGMLVILDNIWNRIMKGRRENKYTWFFADEIYLLFKQNSSAEFLRNLWKRARKFYGIPTGITQNVSDLLENDIARTMISNCEFIQMLNQAPLDRAQLAELLNISDTQLSFITNSSPGEGLIYDGTVIVPFVNKLPKDTAEYEAMTTKPAEIKAREAKKEAERLKALANEAKETSAQPAPAKADPAAEDAASI